MKRDKSLASCFCFFFSPFIILLFLLGVPAKERERESLGDSLASAIDVVCSFDQERIKPPFVSSLSSLTRCVETEERERNMPRRERETKRGNWTDEPLTTTRKESVDDDASAAEVFSLKNRRREQIPFLATVRLSFLFLLPILWNRFRIPSPSPIISFAVLSNEASLLFLR